MIQLIFTEIMYPSKKGWRMCVCKLFVTSIINSSCLSLFKKVMHQKQLSVSLCREDIRPLKFNLSRQDKSLTSQAKWFLYSKQKKSLRSFNDPYFCSMMEIQAPSYIPEAYDTAKQPPSHYFLSTNYGNTLMRSKIYFFSSCNSL